MSGEGVESTRTALRPRTRPGTDAATHREAWDAWPHARAVCFALCWLLALVACYVLAAGFHAMDRPRPDTGAAGAAYGLALGLGVVAMAAGTVAMHCRPLAGVAAAIAIPVGIFQAVDMEGAYNSWLFGGGDGVLLALMILGPIVALAAGIVAAVLSQHRLADFACAAGIALAALVAVAALYHIVTLDHQAEVSRQAHEAPAAVWFMLAWLLLAARRAGPVRAGRSNSRST